MAMKLYPDTAIQDIADAIRSKNGSTDTYTVGEMAQAIEDIPSGGGGYTADEVASGSFGDTLSLTGTTIDTYRFYYVTTLQSVDAPNVTDLGGYAFNGCSGLKSINFPKLEVFSSKKNAFYSCTGLTTINLPLLRDAGDSMFGMCTGLITAVVGSKTTGGSMYKMFYGCSKLAAVEFIGSVSTQTFMNCRALKTLVLRRSEVTPIGNMNGFQGTPLASGGSGATIYIPEELYNHLGDGSSLDYKSATNWATLEANGTITWAKIEGSIYETQHVDGTPIE